MALQKYITCAPFYRQESLQDILGFSMTVPTIFDQCKYLSNDFYPVFISYLPLQQMPITII
jgi:hypothetical protein